MSPRVPEKRRCCKETLRHEIPPHGWPVEATECYQHLADKVRQWTFKEVDVAQQGHLQSFAFFLCDAQTQAAERGESLWEVVALTFG